MQHRQITYHKPADQKSRDYVYGVCKSPFGDCVLIGDMTDRLAIAGLGFCDKSLDATFKKLRNKNFRRAKKINRDEQAIAKLARYLSYHYLSTQKPIPLSLTGTPFQQKVWQALCAIPSGKKTDYKTIANKIGTSPRAIGGALGANPVAWLVPCHRVLSAQNALHGYRWGLPIKEKLLAAENIKL